MRKFLTMCLGLALLTLATPYQVFAQGKYEVKGVVTDTAGVPVIGASVVEQGTTNGVTTDLNGQYTLKVSNAESIVVVSYIGYKTQELVASSSNLLNLVLEEDTELIDDVVIIGYGTVKKNDLTGSVVAVKAEELNRGAVVSTQDMMQGKVPGLQVIPGDGGPNSGSTIRIRGAASLNASNDPLIVIDGVPVASNAGAGMANPLSLVNPNDIESFTVLKDASAAAIYGSRASNGVIIITTKKGKGNKIGVSYNGSVSVSQNSSEMPVMSPEEFRAYAEELPNAGQIKALMGNHNTDWQSLVFRTGISHDHNVSLYGNYNDVFPYRASVGYTGQQGTLETSKFDRATLDVSLAPKFLKDHLTVSINAKGVYTHQNYADGGAVGTAAFFNPTQPPYWYNEDGSIDRTTTNGFWNLGSGTGSEFIPNNLVSPNPLALLYDIENKGDVYRALGNVALDYKVHGFEALRFNLKAGLDLSDYRSFYKTNPGSFQAYEDTDYRGWGQYSEGRKLRRSQDIEFYGNYNETWGKHNLDVMLGYSWQWFYQFDRDLSYSNQTGERNPKSEGLKYQEESYLVSFYGRINYSFDSRYLFTVSLRADGSSKFAKDNRWGYFPAAAFAWNIKNEQFLKDVDAVSALKLRLSYGQTGQQDIPNYQFLARYAENNNTSDKINMGGTLGWMDYYTPLVYDETIKWETTTTYNIGVDFGFLDGLIDGSLDVYRRDTKDLLNKVTTPLGIYYGNLVFTNVGSIRNQGVEFSLNFNPVRTKDWSLRFGINGTFQDTKFTKLQISDEPGYAVYMTKPSGAGEGGAGDLQMHTVGSAPYTFYTYQQAYDSNGNPIQNTFIDRTKDGKISKEDRYNTGKSPMPDFFYGINLKLSYKNWDFGFNGHGSVGNYVYNDFFAANSESYVDPNAGILSNFASTVTKTRWTDANKVEQNYSDMFLENASFFRLDDINLGYTFDKLGNSGLTLRLAAGVQNVFVITKYSGLDPEVPGVEGMDGSIWPRPRIYSLRVNLNF